MKLHLITAEDPLTLRARSRELIRFPQLTMPLLAALTPASWTVTHTDEITHAVDTTLRCDLVGITAATPGAPHAYELAAAFRARSIKVVLGGPHATLLPEEAADYFDMVVAGEAEPLWKRVLQDVENETRYPEGMHILDEHTGANVRTLRSGARIYACPTPANLAGLPRPRRDLIRNGGWNRWWATKSPLIATRGCPHRCSYCTVPLLYPQARQMRLRPIHEIAADVAASPDKGIVFWDDNLGANPRYAAHLFRAIAPYRKWWTSQTTMASARSDEFLRLAAESGCKAFFVGLESVSQSSLNGTNKGHNQVKDYRQLVQRFHSYGIALQAGIVFGFDHDDRGIFARTVDTLGEIGVDNATISLLVPYPGTPEFARLDREKRLIDRDWRHYNGKTHVVFQPALLTPDQLLDGYEWAKRQFYSPAHMFKRMVNSRTGLWWNIPRNLGYAFGLTTESQSRAKFSETKPGTNPGIAPCFTMQTIPGPDLAIPDDC